MQVTGISQLQHHICKKLRIAVLCGAVAVFPFPYPAVKVVRGNDIQPAAMTDPRISVMI